MVGGMFLYGCDVITIAARLDTCTDTVLTLGFLIDKCASSGAPLRRQQRDCVCSERRRPSDAAASKITGSSAMRYHGQLAAVLYVAVLS